MTLQPSLFPDEPIGTVFLFDTSALVHLERQMPRESPVFTAVWEEIERLIVQKRVRTIDFVESEVLEYSGKSEILKDWLKTWKKQFVVPTDIESIAASQPIIQSEWSTGFFHQQKQAEGKDEADPFLIGFAKVHGCIIVTEENKIPHNKLPAIAAKHGVKSITLFEFLDTIDVRMAKIEPPT